MHFPEYKSFAVTFCLVPRTLLLLFLLVTRVASAQSFTQDLVESNAPLNAQYHLLQVYLNKYDALQKQGGWSFIPKIKKSLGPGSVDPLVKTVRLRLEKEWYLQTSALKPDSFDFPLRFALENFQRNNGCMISGSIDAETIAAMNITVEKRVEQLKLNMDRWALLPVDTGQRYILVNVADFQLSLIENCRPLLRMKTIVGKYYRKTPTIHSQLSHIVLNPEWTIPENILVKDILPEIKKDSLYLSKHHMRVYRYEKNGSKAEIDKNRIDWQGISAKHFPFVVVQEPGPWNALGQVKFLFQNPYNVYMHDTPAKNLFKAREPAFSSGCIRLSDAVALAGQLLAAEKGLTKEQLECLLDTGEDNYTIVLREKVPVYIDYFTAWVDELGNLHFRKDIYNRDLVNPKAFARELSRDEEWK